MAKDVSKTHIPIRPLPMGLGTRLAVYNTDKWTAFENWWPSPSQVGAIEQFPGFTAVDGGLTSTVANIKTIAYTEGSDQARRVIIAADDRVWALTNTGTDRTLVYTGSSSAGHGPANMGVNTTQNVVTYGDLALCFNGKNTAFSYNIGAGTGNLAGTTTLALVGTTQPSTTSFTTVVTSTTGSVTGIVQYWYSQVNANVEGPLSAAFGKKDAGEDNSVTLGFTALTSTIGGYRFYRSTDQAATPFFCGAVTDTASVTFLDTKDDSQLGALATYHGGSPPTGCNFPVVHFNRVWAADVNKVYWCDLALPNSWFSNNYLNIQVNDGDQITGMARDAQGLFIFKQNHLYKAVGRDPMVEVFQIIELTPADQNSRNIGTPAHNSIASTPIGHIFYYNAGVYLLSQGSEITYLSKDIEDELRDDVNASAQEKIVAVYDPNYRVYLISIPVGALTNPSRTYGFAVDLQAWFRISEGFTAFGIVESGAFGQPSDGSKLWACRKINPAVPELMELFDFTNYTYDDDVPTAIATLPPIYFGSPGTVSRFLYADIIFETQVSGDFTVLWKIDGQNTASSATVSQIKTGATRWRKRVNFGEVGTEIEITFKSNTADEDHIRTNIYGIDLYGQKLTDVAQ